MLKKYIIEREIPDIGSSSRQEFMDGAAASNAALEQLGNGIHWVESFVTQDKIYCVYLASDEDIILEHSRLSGFPANRISEVCSMLDVTSAG